MIDIKLNELSTGILKYTKIDMNDTYVTNDALLPHLLNDIVRLYMKCWHY